MQALIKTPVQIHNERLDAIEALMDACQVGGMLDLMAEVASAKADHVRSNWQDEKTAKVWDKIATKLLQTQHAILTNKLEG